MIITDGMSEGVLAIAGTDQFLETRGELCRRLLDTDPSQGARWQQLDVSSSPAHATHELLNVTLWYDMPETEQEAAYQISPDLPWSEGHFQERVSGVPMNPGEWHKSWPYHANGAELHTRDGGKYDHNYMERMWAASLRSERVPDSTVDGLMRAYENVGGYRFKVGDLRDVVAQLREDPTTRQAYLPIWFPEDTGATEGQRVPCTIGYHFIIRDGLLHLQYNIRSCEVYRHFTNDVYMAVRLAQWMCAELNAEGHEGDVAPGQLSMHMVSFHGFVGDRAHIEAMI